MGAVIFASVSRSNALTNPGLGRLSGLTRRIDYGVVTDNNITILGSVVGLTRLSICNTVYNGSVCANSLSLRRTVRMAGGV